MSNQYFNQVLNLGSFLGTGFQNALNVPGINHLFAPFCNQSNNQGFEHLHEQSYHHLEIPPVPQTNFVLENNTNKNILSHWQQQELESCFSKNHYPGKEVRLQLSSKLGVSENRLHIWFQNRRAKQRRLEHTKKRPGRPSLANPPKNCSGVPIQDEVMPSQKKAKMENEATRGRNCKFDINHYDESTYLNCDKFVKTDYTYDKKSSRSFSQVRIKKEFQFDENCLLSSENDLIDTDIDVVNEPPSTSTPVQNKKLTNFTATQKTNSLVNLTNDSGIYSDIKIDSKKRKRCNDEIDNDDRIKLSEPKKKLSFSIRSILGEL